MGRGLIILLIVSLGLNIFALGHLSGRMIASPAPPAGFEAPGPRGFHDPFRLMRHSDVLSPESREAFRASFRERLPSLRAEHRKMRELRRELGVLMSADAWDAAAVNAKLQEIRAAQNRQHDAFNTAFMSAFEKLSAEDRKRLIEAAGQHRHDRRKGWREQREEPPGVDP